MPINTNNILIIGAGPTGLTAALEFIKNGIKVDILEKRSGPSTLSKAIGIMPESLVKLGDNISQKIRAESIPFMNINMHVAKKRCLTLDLAHKVQSHEVMTGLPQDRTEEIMRKELSRLQVEVEFNKEVINIITSDDFAEVWINGESTARKYDWVIACDGINSITRKKLNIRYQGYELDNEWSIADVELMDMLDFRSINVWMKLGPKNIALVALPIGSKRIRLISTATNCLASLPVEVGISKVYREGNFNVSIRQATTYHKGRVLLAGDAAHCHSPVGGKGMNLGIADAVAAVSAILNNTPHEYSKERHTVGAAVIKESETMRKMIMSKNPILKLGVKLVFSLVNKSSYLQTIAIKRISSL